MTPVSAFTHATFDLKEGSKTQKRLFYPFFSRLRFQLASGLFVCSLLPAIIRSGGALDRYIQTENGLNTLLITSICVGVGVWALRRLGRLPGAEPIYYVLPIFSAVYAIAAVGLLLLRLDYGRFAFIGSYGLSISWFIFLQLAASRSAFTRLAVLPDVDLTMHMRRRDRIEWIRLKNPNQNLPNVSGIVADLRADLSDDWLNFITDCTLSGKPVFHIKQVREALTGRVEIEHLSENTFGSLSPDGLYLRLKSLGERFFALLLIAVLAPILIVIGIVIRLDSKGAAIFRQERAGFRGKPFVMYKFRTMLAHPPSSDLREAAMTADRDPRITRVGQFLRRTRIDELPQLFNVLKGEMSIIGPRPEAQILSDWYTAELPFYRYRHIVKPGLTGWAQVSQGHVADADQVLEKLHYDFYYIKNISLWLDLVIIVRTIRTMLTGFGAK
ncbi:sugar transferase [Notoacmeibacter sp. MSK16QG-6]|uniref:sugar transferase n=1 Tax=Notoacmeibacter sp. MSK16QG-6 TaxID=2957982 RepID=UPI0020A16B6C|nr:sugar transferase [Notoacmeibacter sp. MSK16QG-6]MCP1198394.1 sugar transferase [Notoacmeibacter sp. MSK16QG-6]